MKYNVMNGKEVLGSFDKKENAEIFARAYAEATGTKAQVKGPAEKAEAKAPELDPIAYAVENGTEALRAELEKLSTEELKAIIKAHGMDPCGTYRNSKNRERLVAGMVSNAEVRINKGNCFRHYEG